MLLMRTMKCCTTLVAGLLLIGTISCRDRLEEKGFAVARTTVVTEANQDGLSRDSLSFPTRPIEVVLTGVPHVRIATIYKVNYNRDSSFFIGANDNHYNYGDIGDMTGNQWNAHILPGFESLYGYNMVNVAHHDTRTQERKNFFSSPVLIKTLYLPTDLKDTLNNAPVSRDYFMISVYDEDTNRDGFINMRDLRRFYYFDIQAAGKRHLVPPDYSVYKSQYDPANDYMYVFAQLDANHNGKIDAGEADHIFWIDLKNPERAGRQY